MLVPNHSPCVGPILPPAVVDSSGLIIYFGLARLIMGI